MHSTRLPFTSFPRLTHLNVAASAPLFTALEAFAQRTPMLTSLSIEMESKDAVYLGRLATLLTGLTCPYPACASYT